MLTAQMTSDDQPGPLNEGTHIESSQTHSQFDATVELSVVMCGKLLGNLSPPIVRHGLNLRFQQRKD